MVKFIGLGAAAGVFACAAHGAGDRFRGIVNPNDGTFTIQGYLEDNGAPADGMYSFRVEAFEDATGVDILSELFFISQPIPVENGLFVLEVQMGGTDAGAREFWRSVGDEEMWLEIGVGEVEGGPYTTLDDRMKVGWGARSQFAGTAKGLTFPIDEFYEDGLGNPLTLITIESVFGGTVLDLTSGLNTDDPIIDITGEVPSGLLAGPQSGAIRIDALDEDVGVLALSGQYPIVGFLDSGAVNGIAGVLGQVNAGVSGAAAVQALNTNGATRAELATDDFAGDFRGDVRVDSGEIVKDFGSSSFSPAGPVAYGFINASGTTGSSTSNISATWDAASEQYELTISGETLAFGSHSVLVTVVDTIEPRVATSNIIDSRIVIKIWDINSGNVSVQDNFQIAVFRAAPDAVLLNAPPQGVDPEVYYERTGQAPVFRRDRAPTRARTSGEGIGG